MTDWKVWFCFHSLFYLHVYISNRWTFFQVVIHNLKLLTHEPNLFLANLPKVLWIIVLDTTTTNIMMLIIVVIGKEILQIISEQ